MSFLNRILTASLIAALCLALMPAAGAEMWNTANGALIQQGEFPQSGGTSSKAAYDIDGIEKTIVAGLEAMSSWIDVSAYQIASGDMASMYFKIVNSHPEFFYVTGGVNWNYSGGVVIQIMPQYNGMTANQIADGKRIIEDEVGEILKSVKPGMTAIEKIVMVNDYFCLNYEYDHNLKIYNIMNLFKDKKGVCHAYTLGFMYIMNRLGIPCETVTSKKMNHIWNLVNVGGQWYHVDVTWNDPSMDTIGRASHEFFLQSDASMRKLEHDYDDWERDHAATDVKFDDCFWTKVYSPFVYLNGDMYCRGYYNSQRSIYKADMANGKAELVAYEKSTPYFIYGFAQISGRLIYPDYNEIWSFDPSSGIQRRLYDASGFINSGMWMFGFKTNNNSIYMTYGTGSESHAETVTLNIVRGDADCDGIVSCKDAVSGLRYISGAATLSDLGFINADTDKDDNVDNDDVKAILTLLAAAD